jgi:hypothetical protein
MLRDGAATAPIVGEFVASEHQQVQTRSARGRPLVQIWSEPTWTVVSPSATFTMPSARAAVKDAPRRFAVPPQSASLTAASLRAR